MDKYLTYPPSDGPFALPGSSIEFDEGCDLWSDIVSAALVVNPAFNVYRIFDMVGLTFRLGSGVLSNRSHVLKSY